MKTVTKWLAATTGTLAILVFFACNKSNSSNSNPNIPKGQSQVSLYMMDGPINFGERDRWWGLVVEGFQEPLYCMNYNQPYYQSLFETYGFQPFFHQICLGMDPKQRLSDKIHERHNMFAKDPAFSSSYINKNQLEKYALDFMQVYNAAWAGHGGLKELRKEQVIHMFKKMKPVMG